MAKYRQIHMRIWKDPWFQELLPEQRYLFIYSFSNESSSISGIYEISLKTISNETGLAKDAIEETFGLFAKAGKAFYEDGVMWVPNLAKYNAPHNPSVLARVREDIQLVPDCPLKHRFLAEDPQFQTPCAHGVDTVSADSSLIKSNLIKSNQEGGAECPRPRKAQKPVPPAVQVFREVVHRFPNKSLYQEIHEAIGEDPAVLGRWRVHLLSWVKRGYNPTNLEGILQAFQGVPRKVPNPEAEAFDAELAEARRKLAEQRIEGNHVEKEKHNG